MDIRTLFFLFVVMSTGTALFSMDGEERPTKRRKCENDQNQSSSSSSSSEDSQQLSIWQLRAKRFEQEEKERRKKREKEDRQQEFDRTEKEKKEREALLQEQELLQTLEELFGALSFQIEELSDTQSFAAINEVLDVVAEALSAPDISFAELKNSANEEIRNFSVKFGKVPAQIIEKIEHNQQLKDALYVQASVEKIDENLKAICTILGEQEVSISFAMNTDEDGVSALEFQKALDQEQDFEDEHFARFVQEDDEQGLEEQSCLLAEQLNQELNG